MILVSHSWCWLPVAGLGVVHCYVLMFNFNCSSLIHASEFYQHSHCCLSVDLVTAKFMSGLGHCLRLRGFDLDIFVLFNFTRADALDT